jgi:hypothetical protein
LSPCLCTFEAQIGRKAAPMLCRRRIAQSGAGDNSARALRAAAFREEVESCEASARSGSRSSSPQLGRQPRQGRPAGRTRHAASPLFLAELRAIPCRRPLGKVHAFTENPSKCMPRIMNWPAAGGRPRAPLLC